jgi:O-antigen/teichoic acid export membrane protein
MGYIGVFSSFGLPSVFQRYIPEFREQRETSNIKKLVIRGSLWRITLSTVFVLLVILFASQVGRLFKIDNWLNYFKLFSLGIIFSLEGSLLAIALTSLFLHKYFVISNIVYVFTRVGVLYFLLKAGWGIEGLLLGEVAAYGILMMMFAYCYYSKFSRSNTIKNKPPFPMKRLFRYGGFSCFNEIGAQILAVSTDFFVISAFLGPIAVGIYAFANHVINLISRWMPTNLLIEVIRPAFFTRYTQTNDVNELGRMFNFLGKFIAFFLFPLTTGTFVLGDKLIMYVFDSKYLSSLKVLWIMAAFTALCSFEYPLGFVVHSIERVEIMLFSKIFAVYNLVADLLVVKPFGVIGIALATCSAVLFKNLFIYAFTQKYTHLSMDFRGFGIIAINSVLMALLLYPLRRWTVDIRSFILVTLVGLVIYFTVAHFNKGFSAEERRIINKILPRPIFTF